MHVAKQTYLVCSHCQGTVVGLQCHDTHGCKQSHCTSHSCSRWLSKELILKSRPLLPTCVLRACQAPLEANCGVPLPGKIGDLLESSRTVGGVRVQEHRCSRGLGGAHHVCTSSTSAPHHGTVSEPLQLWRKSWLQGHEALVQAAGGGPCALPHAASQSQKDQTSHENRALYVTSMRQCKHTEHTRD